MAKRQSAHGRIVAGLKGNDTETQQLSLDNGNSEHAVSKCVIGLDVAHDDRTFNQLLRAVIGNGEHCLDVADAPFVLRFKLRTQAVGLD